LVQKEWEFKNLAKVKQYHKKFLSLEENRIKIRENYHLKKDSNKEKRHQYYENNKESILIKVKNYYEENKEKCLQNSKEWRLSHSEQIKLNRDSWKQNNLEHVREWSRNYQRAQRQENPQFRMGRILRKRLNDALRDQLVGKKVSAVKDLGCSMPEFITYIESKFLSGMSWDNYGKGSDKWNIDHIKALANFDLTNPEQQKQAVHYTNLQPLWEIDNIKKSNKILAEVA
jgi:hypothetical protein